MENQENTTIKSRWEKHHNDRSGVLERARACAELTLPSLLPPDGSKESTNLPTPYQSLGARAVNNLASKLLLTLLPPNTPFFRLSADTEALEELGDQRTEIEEELGKIETLITDSIETQALRSPTFEAFKLLITTGNALIFKEKPTSSIQGVGMRVFKLNQYVVKRDHRGEPIEIITKETISKKLIPKDMMNTISEDGETKKDVDLLTLISRVDKDTWETYQEIKDIEVTGSRGTYKTHSFPYMALRWTAISGEDYGRGIVEQYLGDLRSLESLEQIILESAANMAKILYLVQPNSTTDPKDLAGASSGSFVTGQRSDVQTLQSEKFADLQLAYNSKQDIMQRLSQAFLLNTSVTRQAERVTASEINYMAKELEDALGGVYTVLSQGFQKPLVKLLLNETNIKLPDNLVKPIIVTGLEALGRGHDYDKLVMFAQTLQQLFGGDLVAQYTNVDVVISQLGTSLGINTSEIIKSQEQLQQEQQQAQMQSLAEQGGSAMAQEFGKGTGQNLAGTNPEANKEK